MTLKRRTRNPSLPPLAFPFFFCLLFLLFPLGLSGEIRLESEEDEKNLLIIRVIPSRGEIYFNREFLARKEAELAFNPGHFTLEFRLEGWASETLELDLEEGRRYEIEALLEPALTRLILPPLPPEASIRVDGERVPREESLLVPSGRRRVVVERFGYRPLTWDLTLEPGDHSLSLGEWVPAEVLVEDFWASRRTVVPGD
ncbi:MAG: hypothetical protein LBQ61_07480, partial [Spirochaetales bacterium]|nr:hypothetical protein [Spirochaetales bacterium]